VSCYGSCDACGEECVHTRHGTADQLAAALKERDEVIEGSNELQDRLEAALKERDEARAQLADTLRERDNARQERDEYDDRVHFLSAERDRLRAALEPTAENLDAYAVATSGNVIEPQDWEIQARNEAKRLKRITDLLTAIRARAGLPEAKP
jgi:uncharacterized coiled-coil DUF342 family protein